MSNVQVFATKEGWPAGRTQLTACIHMILMWINSSHRSNTISTSGNNNSDNNNDTDRINSRLFITYSLHCELSTSCTHMATVQCTNESHVTGQFGLMV